MGFEQKIEISLNQNLWGLVITYRFSCGGILGPEVALSPVDCRWNHYEHLDSLHLFILHLALLPQQGPQTLARGRIRDRKGITGGASQSTTTAKAKAGYVSVGVLLTLIFLFPTLNQMRREQKQGLLLSPEEVKGTCGMPQVGDSPHF